MRMPDTLTSLVDEGIIEEVLRPLMSGKEAQIYLVMANGRPCVAKIYKEAQSRTFKHRADYTEGRKVRNTRDQRAIDKRSKHGKGQDEAAWRSTEVDMIYRLQAAGVRVPAPYHFIDGVLVMELVTDGFGEPAPRLGEVDFSAEQAIAIFDQLIREVVRMLCAGVVHGDLSDFNVLLAADGPVIIDLPQAVDPSKNQNARKLLLRDVDNLHRFLARFVPEARRLPYAEEMWALYESNQLTPESPLKGHYRPSRKKADTDAVLELIGEANEDERRRRAAAQPQTGARPRRVEIVVDKSHLRAKPSGPNGRKQPNAFANHAAKAAGLHARQARQPRPMNQAQANPANGNQGQLQQGNTNRGHTNNGHINQSHANQSHANQSHANRSTATRGPVRGPIGREPATRANGNQLHTQRGPASHQANGNQLHAQRGPVNQAQAPRVQVPRVQVPRVQVPRDQATRDLANQAYGNRARGNQTNARRAHPHRGTAARGPAPETAKPNVPHQHAGEAATQPRHRRPKPNVNVAGRATPPEPSNERFARPQHARPQRPAPDQPRYTTNERPQRSAPRNQQQGPARPRPPSPKRAAS